MKNAWYFYLFLIGFLLSSVNCILKANPVDLEAFLNCSTLDYESFEADFGDWIDGGVNNFRMNFGPDSTIVRLRAGNSQSLMTTQSMDWSNYETIQVSFTYFVEAGNEAFDLQVSTNSGTSFNTAKTWLWATDYSQNNQYYQAFAEIQGPFTTDTKIRLQNYGSDFSKNVSMDHILIEGCELVPQDEICDNGMDDDGDGLIDCADNDCDNFPACQPNNGCTTIDENNFESGWDGWIDGGSYCSLETDSEGDISARIYHYTGSSNFKSETYDWTGLDEVIISFSYYTENMNSTSDALLFQLATNGGSFSTIESYDYTQEIGANNTLYTETITLYPPFEPVNVIRFRSVALGLNKYFFIDDVKIETCGDDTVTGIPVIPGAVGFGIESRGGRNGQVIKVTNTNDSGPGSLRACIDASGPRVCVFETSGVIDLNQRLTINDPYITIAGQTAPDPGIAIKGALVITTHDVLMQHISVLNSPGEDYSDAISLGYYGGFDVYNIVLDHVSAGWSRDEIIEISPRDTEESGVTIKNCLFSHPLVNADHPSGGPHGFGLIGSPHTSSSKTSMYRNVLAHMEQRAPLFRADLYMANNIIYNFTTHTTSFGPGDKNRPLTFTLEGNVYKDADPEIFIRDNGDGFTMPATTTLYLDNNFTDRSISSQSDLVDDGQEYLTGTKTLDLPNYELLSAENQINSIVLSQAGPRPNSRAQYHQNVINDVINGTGSLIDHPNEVGGFSHWTQNTHQLNNLPSNTQDSDGDGYTDLEEWLNCKSIELGGYVPDPSALSCGNQTFLNNTDLLGSDSNTNAQILNNDQLKVYQNKPNPFNDQTEIAFNLPAAEKVTLILTDFSGKVIRRFEASYSKGYNIIQLDRRDLAVGIYNYTLQTKEASVTKKLVIQ